ncbi:MAG TPA: STAS domain-containing protein [Chthoniobacteraceae bacterium]|nr:STAS domain-containing protein [Chthoniobacteraceae bacterium]
MQITHHPQNERLLLKLEGRLDGAWSEHVGAALSRAIEEGWHQIALDLAAVSFVSSAGIRVLVIHFKQLTGISGALSVVRPSPEVRSVLEMAGLGMMIGAEAEPVQERAASPGQGEGDRQPRRFDFRGLACEAYPLCAEGTLSVEALSADAGGAGRPVSFPAGSFGVGLGAIGADAADCHGRYGEAMALGGAILVQPADGRQTTDYVISQGTLVPEMMLRSGLAARGDFAELVRFDARDLGGAVPLSTLVALVLERSQQQGAGFVMIAETEALVGASLLVQPTAAGEVDFAFPEVRNQLRFTAEPAWPHTLSLVAGFVVPAGDTAGKTVFAPLLRPVVPGEGEGVQVHIHAAAFPYRPLPKGQIGLPPTLATLMEEESALGLLHLLHDWRPGGVGESRFRRGALWSAPMAGAAAV